jgi:hypothetical protein
MTSEHQATQEERAFDQLLDEQWGLLSEAGRTVFIEAEGAAYAAFMVSTYSFDWPFECDEAFEKMRLAAAELTDREHKLLATFWRAALSAAASIDSEDFETLTGYRVYRVHLHRYYRMFSEMIEDVLEEKWLEKLEAEREKELAEQEPVDFSNLPF